ncbi:MAG: hypothetical protein AAGF49_10225 [Pseudomonadota bacterium]
MKPATMSKVARVWRVAMGLAKGSAWTAVWKPGAVTSLSRRRAMGS